VPTTKRSQINVAQYPRIPSRILKGASYEKVVDYVVAEVAMFGIIDGEVVESVGL
jgi:hypothetical protein